MERVIKTNEKASLCIKTKVMPYGYIGDVSVDGTILEVVTSFEFLETLITKYGHVSNRYAEELQWAKQQWAGKTRGQVSDKSETGEGLGISNSTV